MRTLLFLLFSFSILFSQNKVELNSLQSDFALKYSRIEYKRELKERINKVMSGGIKNEKAWVNLFKDISLAVWRDSTVQAGLQSGFDNFKDHGIVFRRALLETAYTLYPDGFSEEISKIYKHTSDPMVFAYTVNILLAQNTDRKTDAYISELKSRFPDYAENNVLRQLHYDLANRNTKVEKLLPPLDELISHDFERDATIIYSFHNSNREYPGITVIKAPDGSFVKDESGEIFQVEQMAVSVSNFPPYVRGGSTPQGIYSIVGWYVSPTPEIGPTPCVLTRIPFEKPPHIFFHKNNKYRSWHIRDYENLLPDSWEDYAPMYQSYYCGKMGRGLIVMHGSVDDLSFYEEKPYYPLTPTKGCLVTKELWDENDGTAIESDQLKLYNAFISTGNTKGYLVVVDIISEERPVNIEDIRHFIQ